VGLALCGTVFPVSAVVGAAVPAAVCRWGLCPCCPGPDVGRCLSGVYNGYIIICPELLFQWLRDEEEQLCDGGGVNPVTV